MTETPTSPNKPLVLHVSIPYDQYGRIAFVDLDVDVSDNLATAGRLLWEKLADEGVYPFSGRGPAHWTIAAFDSMGKVSFHEPTARSIVSGCDGAVCVLTYAVRVAHFNREGRAVVFLETDAFRTASVSGVRLMDLPRGMMTSHNDILFKKYSALALGLAAPLVNESTSAPAGESTPAPAPMSVSTVPEHESLHLPKRELTPKEFVELVEYKAEAAQALATRYSAAFDAAYASSGKKRSQAGTTSTVIELAYQMNQMPLFLHSEDMTAFQALGFHVKVINKVLNGDMEVTNFVPEGCVFCTVTSPAFL